MKWHELYVSQPKNPKYSFRSGFFSLLLYVVVKQIKLNVSDLFAAEISLTDIIACSLKIALSSKEQNLS